MKVIAIISGFTEADFDITGSRKLYNELRVRFPEHVVEFAQWKEGEDLAKYFNSIGATNALVCAYSWGAGHGLVEFSEAFDGNVRAILCDPVYRSKFPWMRWRALTKFWIPTIRYGDNVSVLAWFTQKLNQPGNDNISAGVAPSKAKVLPYKHKRMDDSKEYHDAAVEAAYHFINN